MVKPHKMEVYSVVNMIKVAMLSVVRIVWTVVMLCPAPEVCQAFLDSRYIINPEASPDECCIAAMLTSKHI